MMIVIVRCDPSGLSYANWRAALRSSPEVNGFRCHGGGLAFRTNQQNYLKLIASGDVDETMLDAIEDYVKRQKKRLGLPAKKEAAN
jgi:hypothetical protein